MAFSHGTSANVIADSISPDGTRVTTLCVTFHRFILAEFNTYRTWTRSSASSRAIPLELMLQRATEFPALPVSWPREKPGMSGGDELDGGDLLDAQETLAAIRGATTAILSAYVERHPDKSTRLHKSLLNRSLEWFMWHTVVVTSTEWDNMFRQRIDPAAQPEFYELAVMMRDAIGSSVPNEIDWFGWHLPFVGLNPDDAGLDTAGKIKVSAARCARTSYLTHDDRRDLADDLRLFDQTLQASGHWAPLENPCVAIPPRLGRTHQGNFGQPWHQARHLIDSGDTVAEALTDLTRIALIWLQAGA